MRIEETFYVSWPPEVVFDYVANPSTLAEWQTRKTSVEQLTDGPPRLGTRVRERTMPPVGKELEQVVELAELDRPRRLGVHVVEGPYPVDGTWSFEPDGGRNAGSLRGRGHTAWGDAGAAAGREAHHGSSVRGYHRNLRRNVGAATAGAHGV